MPRSSRHKSSTIHSDSDDHNTTSIKESSRRHTSKVLHHLLTLSSSTDKRQLDDSDHNGVSGGTSSKRRRDSGSSRASERSGVVTDVSLVSTAPLSAVLVDRCNVSDRESHSSKVSTVPVESSSVHLKNEKVRSSSSRRRESEAKKEDIASDGVVVVANEESNVESSSKSGRKSCSSKVDSKRRSEKESGSSRKDEHHHHKSEFHKSDKDKSDKEKEVDVVSVEKSSSKKVVVEVKRESDVHKSKGELVVVGDERERSRKQGDEREKERERPVKQDVDKVSERQIQDGPQNSKVEKEVEKRTKRVDGCIDNIIHRDDIRDGSDRKLSTRDDSSKIGRSKDEKSKDDSYRDKYRDDLDREYRIRDDKRRDARDISDRKYSRDEIKNVESRSRKSKPQGGDRNGSPLPEDRNSRYKDNRDKKRYSENEDYNLLKPRETKDLRFNIEKKDLRSSKVDLESDRGRSQSSRGDLESSISSCRRKRSLSPSAQYANDQYRFNSKQAEAKYKGAESQDRSRPTLTSSKDLAVGPERASEFHSLEKPRSIEKSRNTTNPVPIRKDENHLVEQSIERSPLSDGHAPTPKKSYSSANTDRRPPNRVNVRRNLDGEELGRRNSGSRDAWEYSTNDDRGNRDILHSEKANVDDDTVSVSSSIHRPSSSLLPPPHNFKSGADNNSSVLGSSEDDYRGRSSNRYKRNADSNMGRGQGNNLWRGIPNWVSPIPNGFIPFHGPPPGGFHPMIPPFPGPSMFGVRPSVELNPNGVPYHITDGDRFSGHVRPYGWHNPADDLRGWDPNNMFGDESHLHGRPDWDHNRHMMSNSGWGDVGADMWKGQSSVNMETASSAPLKDDSLKAPGDELWTGSSAKRQRGQPSSREESIEINLSDEALSAKDAMVVSPQIIPLKSPEISKEMNDNTHQFCKVYLSKLDISADLTYPELYGQCTSLIDGSQYEDDVTRHVFPEFGGTRISATTLGTTFFPNIKPTIFERAMSLYKKQAAEMKGRLPVSASPAMDQLVVTTTNNNLPELAATSCEETHETVLYLGGAMEIDQVPSAVQGSNSEVVADISSRNGEQVAVVDQEVAVVTVPDLVQEMADTSELVDSEKVDDSIPAFSKWKGEDPIPEDPAYNATADGNQVKMEEDSPLLANPLISDEDMKVPSPTKAFDAIGTHTEVVSFSDTVCLVLGSTKNSATSEALIPESFECSLVNLSRIHSPESTH